MANGDHELEIIYDFKTEARLGGITQTGFFVFRKFYCAIRPVFGNALFAFEEELTEPEVTAFSNEVLQVMQNEGFEKGYEKAMDKVREFPNCALLLCSVASLLDGTLILFLVEETEKYEEQIGKLYERAIEIGNGKIKDTATQMVILKYMKRKEYDKAEKFLDTLPDAIVDKKMLKANLCFQQERFTEALCIYEEKLWEEACGVQTTLGALMNCFIKQGNEERIELCVKKISEITDNFGLWSFGKYVADYEMALYHKDRTEVLASLRTLLKSMQIPFERPELPLYAEMKMGNVGGNIIKLMSDAMVEGFKNENGLDGQGFLQGDEELMELLEKFSGFA